MYKSKLELYIAHNSYDTLLQIINYTNMYDSINVHCTSAQVIMSI